MELLWSRGSRGKSDLIDLVSRKINEKISDSYGDGTLGQLRVEEYIGSFAVRNGNKGRKMVEWGKWKEDGRDLLVDPWVDFLVFYTGSHRVGTVRPGHWRISLSDGSARPTPPGSYVRFISLLDHDIVLLLVSSDIYSIVTDKCRITPLIDLPPTCDCKFINQFLISTNSHASEAILYYSLYWWNCNFPILLISYPFILFSSYHWRVLSPSLLVIFLSFLLPFFVTRSSVFFPPLWLWKKTSFTNLLPGNPLLPRNCFSEEGILCRSRTRYTQV